MKNIANVFLRCSAACLKYPRAKNEKMKEQNHCMPVDLQYHFPASFCKKKRPVQLPVSNSNSRNGFNQGHSSKHYTQNTGKYSEDYN